MRIPKEGEIWKYNRPGYEKHRFKMTNIRQAEGKIYITLYTNVYMAHDGSLQQSVECSRECNADYQWPGMDNVWQLIAPITIEEYI